MKRKNMIISIVLSMTIILGFILTSFIDNDKSFTDYKKEDPIKSEYNKLNVLVLSSNDDTITVQDNKNVIYKIDKKNLNVDVGSNVVLEYAGILDTSKKVQEISIMDYSVVRNSGGSVPVNWDDDGIFSKYYKLAKNKLDTLTLDEKIGQLFLVRYEDDIVDEASDKNFGGFVFFENDFRGKTKDQTIDMIKKAQKDMKIPLLTAVDEEGGTVVRVSSNPNLVPEEFKSPKELYDMDGLDAITEDTVYKSQVLKELGLNLNLAPVVDVATAPDAYMYDRSLGQNTDITSKFAKTVINASKKTGVSYTLKHFPGYGNNEDTHTGIAIDNRSLDEITSNDLPPFKAGIDAGAEAVLVNHNIINNIDSSNPASLSASAHNILREDLDFTGIIMTDDIDMGALDSISNKSVKAIMAGNDLIITTDYNASINEVKEAVNDGTISEELIDKVAYRVLAWKYYKGLMYDDYK